ncbi:hypothetical protein GCM10023333_19680 [Ferrimonas pelagia]|uniref:DUF3325 domain-containing protein n=2 Tax=Ferrimonas pelagia TaxID=1177826 RepID=A0ABP9EUA8_9GAMM
MLLSLMALMALTWHVFHADHSGSAMLESEREMVALQSRTERLLTAVIGILAVVLILHLLWMHQLRIALVLLTTACCIKVVWNIIHWGRPGIPTFVATLAGAASLFWLVWV